MGDCIKLIPTMPITPKDHYTLLLRTFKANGVRIVHRRLKYVDGLYCPTRDLITVNSECRDTIYGCYVLCHEYAHYNQKKREDHVEFFNLPVKLDFDERIFELILDAEMEAVKKAYNILKMFGIYYVPYELTPKGYEQAKEAWRNYYFKKEL